MVGDENGAVHGFRAGDRVHYSIGSDTYPGTVVKVTRTSVTVRRDEFRPAPDWVADFVPGGFAGHVRNNYSQRNECFENPDGELAVFRVHRRPKGSPAGGDEVRLLPPGYKWGDGGHLRPGWKAFRDYNF